MLTIVIVGADGAGKSSVSARLVEDLAVPTRRMYLGANPDARTHPLPTTRAVRWVRAGRGRTQHTGGPPALETERTERPQGLAARSASAARATARVSNQVVEEAYQQAIIDWHHARGRVVICDRHPSADHFAHDLSRRPGMRTSRRVHGAILRRVVRQPDLVLVLDADPSVLYARKGEGTLEELASRRDEYLRYAASVDRAVVIDAAQPFEDVVAEAIAAVDSALDDEARGTTSATEPIEELVS